MNKRSLARLSFRVFRLLVVLGLMLQVSGTAFAYVTTDQPDYAPGSVVTISGDNSDGAGYLPVETVRVDVAGPNGYTGTCDATTDDAGAWSCQVTLAGAEAAAGSYSYTATGLNSSVSQSGTFTSSAPAPTIEPTVTATPEPTAAPTSTPSPTPPPPPFIQSDKADYYMGETVTLASGNWQPGETVHLFVNDDQWQSWYLNVDVQADATGTFTYQFQLPNWFVATYKVTATGAVSGVAMMTFTDSPRIGSVTVGSQTGTLTYGTVGNATYTVTPVRQGNGTVNGTLSVISGLPAGVTASFSPNSGTWTSNGSNAFPSFTLTLATSSSTPAGSYTFTVRAADGSDTATNTGTLTIGQRPLTVSATASNKTYDGITAASVTLADNRVSGDTFTVSYTSATFVDKNVGTGKTVTVNGISILGGASANYALQNTTATTTANITARALTVTATGVNKVYDGTTSAAVTLSDNRVAGDLFTDSYTSASFSDKNVGNGKTVSVSGISISGTDAGNYTFNTTASTTADITPRPVTVTADAKSKTYGTADPTLTYQITSGSLASGDSFSGALTRVAGETVGTYAIQQGTLGLNGNYALTYAGANLTIGERPVQITADAKSKTYGEADPGLTYHITSGSLVTGDSFSGAMTRAAGENVGTYAIQQGTLALSSNYALTFVGADLTITKRPITVAADAKSKVYGDADPALTYQITSGSLAFSDAFTGALTRAAGEDVGTHAITQGSLALNGNYDLTYVGANLTIGKRSVTVTADAKSKTYGDSDPALTYQITSGSLAFSDAFTGALTRDAGESVGAYAIAQGSLALSGNYELTYVSANLTIIKRLITVTADAKSKTYGDSDPALTYQITSGSLAFSDAFTGALTRAAGESVGTYAITQGTLALSGNYDLTYVGADLTISARAVTVTADAKTKVYGDTDPALTYQITSGSLAFSDAFTGALTRAAGEEVGTYAITQGTLALNSNYVLTYAGANLTISARAVTVTADAKTKVYGNGDPALTYQITSGNLVFGDTFSGALTRLASENVGDYAIQQGTLALSSNYALTYVGANLSITKRPIVVTADSQTKVYGDADPTLTYKITSGSLAFSDAFTGALQRAAGEDVGFYTISQGTLALNANYDMTFVGTTLEITARHITVTADPKTKVYGDSDPALTYQITSGSLAFSDGFSGSLTRTAGENVGTYAITKGSLALSSNYDLTYVGANLTITKRPVTVTADAKSKVYGTTDPALTYQITSGSLAFSDAFTGGLTRAPGEHVGTYAIGQGTLALSTNYVLSYVGNDLMITSKTINVTADAKTKTYGDSDPALTYTFSPALVSGDSFSGALTRDAGEHVGQYDIKQGTLALSTDYTLVYTGAKLTITKRPISVVADDKTKVYGETDPALTYHISSGNLVFGDTFSGALTRAAGEGVGDHAILQGSLALSGDYDLSYGGAILTITKRPITVTADAKSKVYGDADPALTFQITSGSLAFSDAFSGALTRNAGQSVGTYAITQGSLTAGSNYDLTYVGANLTITKRPVTVTADAKSKVYGTTDPALTYQITSGSLAFTDSFAGSLMRDAGETVGAYAINQGALALNSNYTLTYVGANLMITKRPVTVTADAKAKVYGTADPALTYQITSGTLAFSDGFAGDLTRATGEDVGTYAINQGTLALNGNYTLTYVGANLTITKATLTVTADNKAKFFGAADPVFTFTYAGFKFSDTASVVDTPPTCTVTVAHTVVGTYPIVCSGGVDNNYSFLYVNGTLTVMKWTLYGFYQPVDMPTPTTLVYNTVKGGSTVPLKFEIFAGPTELTDVADVESLTYAQTNCSATAIADDIETLATGGTVLRYDSTGGQFIFNWKTPVGAGKCYRVTMTAIDNSSLAAYFKMK
jgi:hypothetical protein